MANLTSLQATALGQGRVLTVLDEDVSAPGSIVRRFAITSDSVLVSLWVDSVAGNLDVTVYTMAGDDDNTAQVISFPTISAPTTELELRKAAEVMQYIKIVVTYTGACKYTIRAKAISTGEASVKILGQNAAKNYGVSVNTIPSLLIPAALVDRVGIGFHNPSTTQLIYLSFTSGNDTSADGWEVGPGEKIGLDIASGVPLYGRTDTGTIRAKVLEAGS